MSRKDKTIAGFCVALVTMVTMGIVVFLATTDGSASRAGAHTSAVDAKLKPAATWKDLRAQVADCLADWLMQQRYQRARSETTSSGWRVRRRASRGAGGLQGAMSAAPRDAMKAPAPASKFGPSHHTGTNNQVAGVEEADIVQTDGRHIYTIRRGELIIVKSWPASETAVVARHRLPANVTPRELLVYKDRLVVLSQGWGDVRSRTHRVNARRRRRWRRPSRWAVKTRVTVLDIANRSAPRVVRDLELEGKPGQTRMIGRKLYLVTTSPMNLPRKVVRAIADVDWRQLQRLDRFGGLQQAAYEVVHNQVSKRIRQTLSQKDLEELLPQAWMLDSAGQPTAQRALHAPGDLYVPSTGSQPGLLSFTRIDVGNFDLDSTGIMAHGSTVYASHDAFYVAQRANRWWRGGGSQQTRIHKFSVGKGEQAPKYAASGVVPGTLLNPFSMDEHKGHLRVATTTNARWNRWRGRRRRSFRRGGNDLYVLAQRGADLKVVGSIRGLAKGERIKSTRFLGDEGYVVTFRRTDPLFTLDLSNPTRPRVMGELKVNGYSSYMHPLGKRHLLTIGQDATGSGRVTGVHLQIFDVGDLTDPRRLHHHRLSLGAGRSYSAAESNHHAFTYDPKTRVLAFPVSIHDRRNSGSNFTGLMLFTADPWSGLRELGRIDHGDLGLSRRGRPCIITAAGHCAPHRRRTGRRAPAVRRAMIIDGFVYSLSDAGLKVNQAFSPETEVAQVVF